MLALLGCLATALDDASEYSAKVTPFRVVASPAAAGQPTPEGLHRDGVTLVTSLQVGGQPHILVAARLARTAACSSDQRARSCAV